MGAIGKAIIGIAVLGILGLFVVANCSGYDKRRYVTDAAAAADKCREAVEAFVAKQGAFPSSAAQAGCATQPQGHAGPTRVAGARIEVEFRDVDPRIDGRSIVLEATSDANQQVRATAKAIAGWRCSATVAPENFKFLPANCRQAPLPP